MGKNRPRLGSNASDVAAQVSEADEAAQQRLTRYHALAVDEVADLLQTSTDSGLSPAEAARRLGVYGPNQLRKSEGVKFYMLVVRHLFNFMSFVLFAAFVMACVTQQWIDAGVVAFLIFINTIIGVSQEYKSEKTMEALKKMASPTSLVIRGGADNAVEISSSEIVPGDLVLLGQGDRIPADMRLVAVVELECDEALLTGESIPVEKTIAALVPKEIESPAKTGQTNDDTGKPEAPDVPLGDRTNVAFMSSTVSKGRGKGIVVHTGQRTELGKIADSIASQSKDKTKLEKRMNWLGIILAIVALIAVGCVLMGLWGWDTLETYPDGLQVAVATAVAIIPEALLPVITLCLTLGVRRMALKKALVRKLGSLEQLGNVSDICSDKTGTLTQGKMVATDMWLPAHTCHYFSITGKGFDPTEGYIVRKDRRFEDEDELDESPDETGDKASTHERPPSVDDVEMQQITTYDGGRPVLEFDESIRMALLVSALCNNSGITQKEHDKEDAAESSERKKRRRWLCWDRKTKESEEETGMLAHEEEVEWVPVGSPTEVALYVMARKLGVERSNEEMTSVWEKMAEYPFDSTIKLMSVALFNKEEEVNYLFSKGAPERLLPKCTRVLTADGEVEFDEEREDEIKEMNELMADDGLRVLALAYNRLPDTFAPGVKRDKVEEDLVFVGLVGIKDPPRDGVIESIEICERAGIAVHMLTGDHPSTSTAIARQIGIIGPSQVATDAVMTSTQFDQLTMDELEQAESLPLVIARCSPESKVKMVQALHDRDKIVAMTGDGVNDSPAISAADVGISMGISGSDVTKEASDIILTDDDFSTVVRAIEEGRRIFANIRRFIVHLMAGNVAEGIILVLGICVGLDPPLNPLQILWINLVTGTPPAMVLSVQPASRDLMNKRSRPVDEGLFTKGTLMDIVFYGVLMGALSLGSFVTMVYAFDADLKEAQATTYITLTMLLLAHAYNCRRLRRSMFGKQMWKAYGFHLSFLFGIGSVCFTLYVPKVNDLIFHSVAPGRWAWVLAIGSVVAFVVLSELYKLIVHRLLHHLLWLMRGGEAYEAKRQAKKAARRRQRQRGLRRFALKKKRRERRKNGTDADDKKRRKNKNKNQKPEKKSDLKSAEGLNGDIRTEADLF